jgi:hypothetical protein
VGEEWNHCRLRYAILDLPWPIDIQLIIGKGQPPGVAVNHFFAHVGTDSRYLKTERLCDLDWLCLTPVFDCTLGGDD